MKTGVLLLLLVWVLAIFTCGVTVAVLDTQDVIDGEWAKALWSFLIGSTTGAAAMYAARR